MMGEKVANDADSYRYLAESIRMHPDQESLKTLMEEAGLARVEYFNMTAGVVACTAATSSGDLPAQDTRCLLRPPLLASTTCSPTRPGRGAAGPLAGRTAVSTSRPSSSASASTAAAASPNPPRPSPT